MPSVDKAVDNALDNVAARMSIVVRNRAIEMGWPKDVAYRMSVTRTASGLGVNVDPEVEEQAKDLEYGSAKSSPRSAIATLHNPRTQQFQRRVAHESMDDILNHIRRLFI